MAYKPELWAEAKKKCRLNEEDIRMAKEISCAICTSYFPTVPKWRRLL